jgi:transposase
MAHRHEVSDAEWARVAPFLPPQHTRATYYRDHRTVLNGMLYRHATGCAWRDLPERYGPWSTVHSRLRRWTREGLWDRILQALQRDLDFAGQIDWRLWCIDGSHVWAHRVAAGAGENRPPGEPADHALGRSRGGFTTKLHLVTDGTGLPLAVALSAGQAHESQYVKQLLDAVHVPRRTRGRRRKRPRALAGDKGYSYPMIRAWLRQRHIRAVIPERTDQVRRRTHRPGRKLTFDRAAYRRRHVIENCVGWLKEARGIATRFEELAIHYLGLLKIGMIRQLLRRLLSLPVCPPLNAGSI